VQGLLAFFKRDFFIWVGGWGHGRACHWGTRTEWFVDVWKRARTNAGSHAHADTHSGLATAGSKGVISVTVLLQAQARAAGCGAASTKS
jgi:hypothetical protein